MKDPKNAGDTSKTDSKELEATLKTTLKEALEAEERISFEERGACNE